MWKDYLSYYIKFYEIIDFREKYNLLFLFLKSFKSIFYNLLFFDDNLVYLQNKNNSSINFCQLIYFSESYSIMISSKFFFLTSSFELI
jgi:hypothetical protein